VDSTPKTPEDQRALAPKTDADGDSQSVESLAVIHKRTVAMAAPWERVLKAACEEGDIIVALDGSMSVKIRAMPEFYRLARQAFPNGEPKS